MLLLLELGQDRCRRRVRAVRLVPSGLRVVLLGARATELVLGPRSVGDRLVAPDLSLGELDLSQPDFRLELPALGCRLSP